MSDRCLERLLTDFNWKLSSGKADPVSLKLKALFCKYEQWINCELGLFEISILMLIIS